MKIDDLKKELLGYIKSSNDEILLSLLKEDVMLYETAMHDDITDVLSKEQLDELRTLSEEEEHDTENWEVYKKATDRWRMK